MRTVVICVLILLIVCGCLYRKTTENFGGHYGGRRGGYNGGRGYHGGRGYLQRFRRRNYGNWFRPPMFWNYWSTPCNCKRGCTPNGCASPGNGPDDCVWASDCNCCGNMY